MKYFILILLLGFLSCGKKKAGIEYPHFNTEKEKVPFLIETERVFYIEDCQTSGIFIYSGYDNNINKVLDIEEKDSLAWVCDGIDMIEHKIEGIQIMEVIDPCGDDPLEMDEILFKLSNGQIISYWELNGIRHLTDLPDGFYTTTDQQRCSFQVINNNVVD